ARPVDHRLPPARGLMPIEIAPCRSSDELLQALAPVFHYFGATPDAQAGERFLPFIEPSRGFIARENGVVVGGCAPLPLAPTVPGGRVRAPRPLVPRAMPT